MQKTLPATDKERVSFPSDLELPQQSETWSSSGHYPGLVPKGMLVSKISTLNDWCFVNTHFGALPVFAA